MQVLEKLVSIRVLGTTFTVGVILFLAGIVVTSG